MEKGRQHLDDFLRDSLNGLPNAPVDGFEKLEQRMAAKHRRGVLLLFLVPLLASGIFWLSTLNESDLTIQPQKPANVQMPMVNAEERAPAVPTQVPEIKPVEQKVVVTVVNPKAVVPLQKAKMADVEEVEEPTAPVAEEAPAIAEVIVISPRTIEAHATTEELKSVAPAQVMVEQVESESEVYVQPKEADLVVVQPKLQVIVKTAASQTPTTNTAVQVAASPMQANPSRWSIHANFYPNYTFRELEVKQEYKHVVNSRYQSIVNQSERGGFAFNAGISVRYNLGNDLFLGSGLGYIEMKVNGNYNYVITENFVVTKVDGELAGKTGGLEDGQRARSIDQGIIQSYRYLQMPLHISYQPWATNKLRLLIEGGVSYVRFINADGATLDPVTLVVRNLSDLEYTKNLGSFDVKIGMAYFVSNQVSFGVEPSLMYFSNSIFADSSPLYVVPWSVGVNFNVTMRLF